jgi:hypothetical protein
MVSAGTPEADMDSHSEEEMEPLTRSVSSVTAREEISSA